MTFANEAYSIIQVCILLRNSLKKGKAFLWLRLKIDLHIWSVVARRNWSHSRFTAVNLRLNLRGKSCWTRRKFIINQNFESCCF